jgi:EAL domain-containing protein (putative c-di-GMP-specific phosphodiesterase class I)
VEQQEDFDWLREAGIDFVQGNFVEPPVTLGTAGPGAYRGLN